MTSRVGLKGQVVIPKEMRTRLGIASGDEVRFSLEGDGVRIEPAKDRPSLRGQFAGFGLTAALQVDHRAERNR